MTGPFKTIVTVGGQFQHDGGWVNFKSPPGAWAKTLDELEGLKLQGSASPFWPNFATKSGSIYVCFSKRK